MNTSEDEPLSGLNGRLRPRRVTSSPQAKIVKKIESKTAQDKLKRSSNPSKAFSSKTDDLANKSESYPATLFLCPYCDRKFASKQTASKHARRIHLSTSKQDSFIACLFCNHTEAEANDIIRHMVDSHPNQYFACLNCHTRFSSTSELAEHKLNVCEKQKPYRSKLRQKSSSGLRRNQKNVNIDRKDDFRSDKEYTHGFNGIVISCELKPSQVHDGADIEDNITTNLILPPSKSLASSAVIEKNAVIVLDDIQWNKRIPPNFSFHNTDADQILSRLGVVHRSPRTGESTRRDWFKTIDDSTQKFEKCFDTSFYSKVASNVQENLAKCLDGSFNFNPDLENTIKTRKAKNSVVINTAEGFPILLAFEQYSRNMFDSYMPRSIAPKHKWKWDSLESDKTLISPDQIKRDSHTNNCIITLVSSLDIWTQLRMRKKFEEKFNISHVEKKTEKQNMIDRELKEILESREIPTSSSQLVKFTNKATPITDTNDLPSYLGLTPSAPSYDLQPAVLSGEWVRPRCYVCCACGAQTRDCRALSSHISIQHPNAQVQHYEIVGEPLLNADILKHLYVPPSQVSNRTRPLRGIRDCTKCKKSVTLEDLHQHMLDCAGDTPTVRRKCRYRPFGVRRRRPRLPDNAIRRKIRKDIRNRHKQKNHMRPRQKIRSEVGDAETIRKMIADLPAKRHRVMLNPMNQALRPRRKIEKQRSKLILKHRVADEAKKRNLRNIKELNNTTKPEKIPNEKEEHTGNTPIKDDDDKPLKPKRRLTGNSTRRTDSLKRKTVVNRAKRKIQVRNESTANKYELENAGPSNDSPNEGLPIDDAPQRIDFNNSQFSARQHSGRGGNFNRGNNQEAREGNNNVPVRQNGDIIDNGVPVQNSPLKHSIASLTADLERHDKSVQFQPHFLIQQECNNTNQHVPTGQHELFENEAPDVTLDKPPLSGNQKVPIDPLQKNKSNRNRKGLNACIDMLRNKLGDSPLCQQEPILFHMNPSGLISLQCGNDNPIDPRSRFFMEGPPIDRKIDPNPAEIFSRSVIPQSAYNIPPCHPISLEQARLALCQANCIAPSKELVLSERQAQVVPNISEPLQQNNKSPVKRKSARLRPNMRRRSQQTMFGLPSQIEVIPQKSTGISTKNIQQLRRSARNAEQCTLVTEAEEIRSDTAHINLQNTQLESTTSQKAEYHHKYEMSGGHLIENKSFQQNVDSRPLVEPRTLTDQRTIEQRLFAEQRVLGGLIPPVDPGLLPAQGPKVQEALSQITPHPGPRPFIESLRLPEQMALLEQQQRFLNPRPILLGQEHRTVSSQNSLPEIKPHADQISHPEQRGQITIPDLRTQQINQRVLAVQALTEQMAFAEQRAFSDQRTYTDQRIFSNQPTFGAQRALTEPTHSEQHPDHTIVHPESGPYVEQGSHPNQMICSGQGQVPDQTSSTDSTPISDQKNFSEQRPLTDNKERPFINEPMLPPEQIPLIKRIISKEKKAEQERKIASERRASTEHWVPNERWAPSELRQIKEQVTSSTTVSIDQFILKEPRTVKENQPNQLPELKSANDHKISAERRSSREQIVSVGQGLASNERSLAFHDRRFSSEQKSSNEESQSNEQKQLNDSAVLRKQRLSREQQILNQQRILNEQSRLQDQRSVFNKIPYPEDGEKSKQNHLKGIIEKRRHLSEQRLLDRRLTSESRLFERELSSDRKLSESLSSTEQEAPIENQSFHEEDINNQDTDEKEKPEVPLPAHLSSRMRWYQDDLTRREHLLPRILLTESDDNKDIENENVGVIDLSVKPVEEKTIDILSKRLAKRFGFTKSREISRKDSEVWSSKDAIDLPTKIKTLEEPQTSSKMSNYVATDNLSGESSESNETNVTPSVTEVNIAVPSNSTKKVTNISVNSVCTNNNIAIKTDKPNKEQTTTRVNVKENNFSKPLGKSTQILRLKRKSQQYLNATKDDTTQEETKVSERSLTTADKFDDTINYTNSNVLHSNESINSQSAGDTSLPCSNITPLSTGNVTLPINTLPSPVTVTPNKCDITAPVYTLSNACISVTKIESSSSATSTNTLSVDVTTVANTTSVYTLTNTSVEAPLHCSGLIKNNPPSDSSAESNSHIQVTTPDENNTHKIHLETKEKNMDTTITSNPDQDPETAKKIAMLPKELVEILGTMPADHRNQLLNILPQYVSISTAATKCNSNNTVTNASTENTNKSEKTLLPASPEMNRPSTLNYMESPEQQRTANMHGLNPSYFVSSNLPQCSSKFLGSFTIDERHAMSYLTQPPPPPPQSDFTLFPPLPTTSNTKPATPPPNQPLLPPSATSTQSKSAVQYLELSFLPPLPPNTPPPRPLLPLILKTDEDLEDVKPVVMTIKPKQEPAIEDNSGVDDAPHVLFHETDSNKQKKQKDPCNKKIIDLTKDDTPNVAENLVKVTEDHTKPVIIPTKNIASYTDLVNTQKQKNCNDKTASLRAVRIKAPSERNKSSVDNQMNSKVVVDSEVPTVRPTTEQENQLGIKLLPKPIDEFDQRVPAKPAEGVKPLSIRQDDKLNVDEDMPIELKISLAIQQAEISSTQHNKSNSLTSKLSITASPISPEICSEKCPETSVNNKLYKPTSEAANIVFQKDKDLNQIPMPLGVMKSSVIQRESSNLEPLTLQNVNPRDEFQSLDESKITENDSSGCVTKDVASQNFTSTQMSGNELDIPLPPPLSKTENSTLHGDDSDDDVSLAIIVKNRDILKNCQKSVISDNLNENSSGINRNDKREGKVHDMEKIEKRNRYSNDPHVDNVKHTQELNCNLEEASENIVENNVESKKVEILENKNTRVKDIIQTNRKAESTHEVTAAKHQFQKETLDKQIYVVRGEVKNSSQDDLIKQNSATENDTPKTLTNELTESNPEFKEKTNPLNVKQCDQRTNENTGTEHIISSRKVEDSCDYKPNIDTNAKKCVIINDSEKALISPEKCSASDLQICSEIEQINVTPLRRSRRGKSMYDNAVTDDDNTEVSEVCIEQRTPLTKKQLIFSKLLLDEENHNKPQAFIPSYMPQCNLTIVNNNIQPNIEKSSTDVIEPQNELEQHPICSVEKRKVPKRKKSVKIRRKSKKKKSNEFQNELKSAPNNLKPHLHTDTFATVAVAENSSGNIVELKDVTSTENELQPNQSHNKDDDVDLDAKDECMFTEKRKLGESSTDIVNKNVKTKKPKLLNKNDCDFENKSNNDNEKVGTKGKEKALIIPETRTACYMPVAARRTRSKSVIVKSSADSYDPYDIDLDEMIENTESFKRKKYTQNLKINTQYHGLSTATSKNPEGTVQDTSQTILKKSIKCKDQLQTSSGDYKTITPIDDNLSDSDDSSKSDVPLKKYIENKEKKTQLGKSATIKRNNNDVGNTNKQLNTKGKQQKKNRRTLATFNNVDKSRVTNEADERRSEQFMESFGFFSERKPRKSNLLATKKISETFHIIANESDDVYFGTKNRTNKRSLQNENKKSTGGVENRTRRQVLTKKIIRRAPLVKKQVCLPVPTYCRICQKQFRRPDNYMRHQMNLFHISKLSEVELKKKTFPIIEKPNHLVVFRQQLERLKRLTRKVARNKNNPKYAKIKLPTLDDILVKVHKIVEKQLLAQRGLSRDEALFLDCCQLLKANKNEINNVEKPAINTEPNRYACTETTVKTYDLLDKPTKGDGDVDSITAKNILESEEVRNLEKDLISGLKEAANASTLKTKIPFQRSVSDVGLNQEDDGETSSNLNVNVDNYEQKETHPATNPTKIKKPEVKEKMYPDIEEIDMFEDKFDKIKRKCRSQAAAAKQTQAAPEPNISQKPRKKSEKKKVRRNSKKIPQSSQVLTKGALKGFDGIKVSIPTSDINMAAIVPPIEISSKKKKKNSSKKKRDKDYDLYAKYNSQSQKDAGSTSRKDIDVYEFMDNEDAEVFEFRPSTLMERFKSISNKDTPSTSKANPVIDENTSETLSDGDDFVYMSDDYVCSDDETENSLLSCELSHSKTSSDIKKHSSPLKRKDAVEKNAVMGRIFKHNAVRSDRKSPKAKESAKPKANLDQLFDSLLEDEPNSSMLNNDSSSPKKDDFLTPKKYDKYNRTSSSRDEFSSPPKMRSPSPKLHDISPVKESDDIKVMDIGPSTSKKYDEYSKLIDYGPSTSKKRDIILPKDVRASSPKKQDSTLSKKHDNSTIYKTVRHSETTKIEDVSHKALDSKDKPMKEKSPSTKLDEGISTSYDYGADVFDQYDDMGVARQRARRKCTVGKQNVLAETWSSESEPDGLPPRPNSAESVVLSSTRKRKGKKKESQSSARRYNNRHISFKRQDDIRVSSCNRSVASSSGVGRAERYEAPVASTSHAPLGPPPSGSGSSSKPRPRSSTYYWSSEGDDEQEHVQQHGWIVGDSHKKLVTMLAHAKGRKRNNDDKRHLVE